MGHSKWAMGGSTGNQSMLAAALQGQAGHQMRILAYSGANGMENALFVVQCSMVLNHGKN